MTSLAIAGAGAIARALIEGIERGWAGDAALRAIGCQAFEVDAATTLAAALGARVTTELAELSAAAELVVEAASPEVVRRFAAGWLERADVMVLSAGALIEPAVFAALREAARRSGRRIFVPSGAVAGIDGVRAATRGGLRSLRLRTTKPPRGLAGAPFVVAQGIDLDALTEPTTIFTGGVSEAVRGFPSNVNVAAVLQLAAPEVELAVSVVADPGTTRNTHEIEAVGEFGTFTVRLDNEPSPLNPKTSALAPLSALALLRRIGDAVTIGA